MKTAIYIEDGTVQLVLTPESAFEKDAMKMFGDNGVEAQVFRGSFYDCRGGWVRQTAHQESRASFGAGTEDQSLILKVQEPKKEEW